MMPILYLLVAPVAVVMTTFGATSEDTVEMTEFSVQDFIIIWKFSALLLCNGLIQADIIHFCQDYHMGSLSQYWFE